ncbi:ROK family protein [Ruminococcaceae bacterium OttesenSCG-928-D13]|nr:ROK family protein [Ruminococcaceae bacterium OttesenSCG-928-D13]
MAYCLGLDIGGTKCAVLLGSDKPGVDKDGFVLDRQAFATAGPAETLDKAGRIAAGMLAGRGISLEDVTGLGVSCGGPLDTALGRIKGPPNLCGWDDVPVANILREKLGVPVRLENDANACALAEWHFGAGRGNRNMIFLTFGTGLGAGLILDGRLYAGTSGMAGEVGHLRLSAFGPVGYGKAGSFEGFCSGGGIAQLAQSMVRERHQRGEKPALCPTPEELPLLTAKTVGDAAEAGDALAREIYTVCGEYLGRGLAVLVDILNPEVIVLGSIFQRSEGLLRPAMERVLRQESLPHARNVCRVAPAGLAEAIGDYAALSLALANR